MRTIVNRNPIASTVVAMLALSASVAAVSAPVSISYYKDAETHNTTGGAATPNDIASATSVGPTYTQADETMTASGGGATSTTVFGASIQAGMLRAKSLSTTTGQFSGAIGTGLGSFAVQQFSIDDTLTAVGGNAGDPVNLTLTLSLDALLTYVNVATSNSALCGFGSIQLYADVGGAQHSLSEDLCSGAQNQTLTASFNAVSGTSFDLLLGMYIESGSEIGAGDPFGSSVSIDASNTGKISFTAPQGYSLTGSNGYDYLQATGPNNNVPEPGTLALVGIAALGLASRRRAAPRAATQVG